jgi:predicted phosphodiesterase
MKKRDPRNVAQEALRLRSEGWSWRRLSRHFGTPHSNLRYWIAKYGSEADQRTTTSSIQHKADAEQTTVESDGPTIKTLEALLDAAEVDLGKWRVTKQVVNTWAGNWQVKAWLEPVPEWLPDLSSIDLPDTPTLKPMPDTDGVESVLFVPDQQFGWRWDFETGELDPVHDPVAVALAEEVARRMKPDVIVLAGDVLDFAAFSTKYVVDPALRNTATQALQAAHDHIAALAAVAQVFVLPGNHDIRVSTAATSLIPELAYLQPANSDVPLLALERLLDLEPIGACVVPGGYPHAELFLFDGTARFTHGVKVKQRGGQTAAAVLQDAQVSTYFGHIHRAEVASRTIHTHSGRRVLHAGSPGTLSRLDGVVPGSHRPDWQQAVMPIYYRNGCQYPSLVHFEGRSAVWEGKVLAV